MARSTVTPPELERDLPASTRHGTTSNPDAILATLHQLLAEDATWTDKIAEADANGEPTHTDDLIEHRADGRDSITELDADLNATLRAGAPIPAAWLHADPPASDPPCGEPPAHRRRHTARARDTKRSVTPRYEWEAIHTPPDNDRSRRQGTGGVAAGQPG